MPLPTDDASSTHSAATRTAEKRSFHSELRRRDAEMSALQEENFSLKMQLRQAHNMHFQSKEQRRISSTPPPEQFYEFNDSADPHDSNRSISTDPQSEEHGPVVKTLRQEVSILREENKGLSRRNNDLSDALDDLYEQHESEKRKAEDEARAARREMQSLVNQVEDLQSENFKLSAEMTQALDHMQHVKEQFEAVVKEKGEMEKKQNAAKAKAHGLQLQFCATVDALEESRSAKETAVEKMGLASIELRKVKLELEEAQKVCDEARAKHAQLVRQTARVAEESELMRSERDAATAKLQAEQQRARLWSEASELVGSNDLLLAGQPSALEDLVVLLKRQQAAYEESGAYQPRWRERVLGDMNECLRALYRSQKEIELKREQFVEAFGTTPDVESHLPLVSSA